MLLPATVQRLLTNHFFYDQFNHYGSPSHNKFYVTLLMGNLQWVVSVFHCTFPKVYLNFVLYETWLLLVVEKYVGMMAFVSMTETHDKKDKISNDHNFRGRSILTQNGRSYNIQSCFDFIPPLQCRHCHLSLEWPKGGGSLDLDVIFLWPNKIVWLCYGLVEEK